MTQEEHSLAPGGVREIHNASSFSLPIHCLLHDPKRHQWPQLETVFGSLIFLLLSPSERFLCAQGNSGFSGFREVRE